MDKKILVLGSFGKIGEAIVKELNEITDYSIYCISKFSLAKKRFWRDYNYDIDILNFKALNDFILNVGPDYIINAAAFTNVDLCESKRDECWKLNVELVENLAKICRLTGIHLIHFSTDYIFDGLNGPYKESSIPNPINFYGISKLAAENSILIAETKHTIVRTNFLYGTSSVGKDTFVSSIINLLKQEKTVNVVHTLKSNPILTTDIAYGIIRILSENSEGIFNFSGPDYLTRYEIALAVAEVFNLNKNLINLISIDSLQMTAKRPIKAGLVSEKAKNELNIEFQNIFEGLREYKSQLELLDSLQNLNIRNN